MLSKKIGVRSDRGSAFWRAYLTILNEHVPLVDHWNDGTATWHPQVVPKMCRYRGVPATKRNRLTTYHWLVRNCTHAVDPSDKKAVGYLTGADEQILSGGAARCHAGTPGADPLTAKA